MKVALVFQWQIISKYRAELMGIAILNVLIAHCLRWSQAEYGGVFLR